jgi:uncharacterized protein YjiS (DUF1127 family)
MIALAHRLLPTSITTSLRRVGAVLGAALGPVVTRWRHRREIRNLSEFDDRMLSDIGLTRSEVQGALAEPFFSHRAVLLARWDESASSAKNSNTRRALSPSANCHASMA